MSFSISKEVLEKYPSLNRIIEVGIENHKWSHDGREVALLNYVYSHSSLPQMRNNPPKILEVIDEFSAQRDFLMNIGPDKGAKVSSIITEAKPLVFVECGSYVGYSAILFADKMRQAAARLGDEGHKPQYWCLELEPLFGSIVMNLVELAGLSDIVKVVVGPAQESLKRLQAEGKLKTIDMLYLDHVEAMFVPDLKACENMGLVKEGSTVIADNILYPGAPEYRKYVREHPGWESHALEGWIIPDLMKDEMEVTKVKAST